MKKSELPVGCTGTSTRCKLIAIIEPGKSQQQTDFGCPGSLQHTFRVHIPNYQPDLLGSRQQTNKIFTAVEEEQRF
jgi:hypothetical protein